jgi:hypothetical protein
MMHSMSGDDALSLAMFWAGALMVFAPLIFAAVVLGVWWRQRAPARDAGAAADGELPVADPAAGPAVSSSPPR